MIIDLGDCDRRPTFGGVDVVDSRLDGDEAVFARMAELRDRTIESMRLDPETVSLSLHFSDDVVLELLTLQDASLESEQWSIQLFDGRAVAVFGRRRWKLGPASATAYWNDPDSSSYWAG